MTRNDITLLALLLVAGFMVAGGAYLIAPAAGLIVGGVELAALAVLFFLDGGGSDT